ncbi:pyridoxamine 5'-phosphate oxidase family protein [Bacillus sp. SD075]|nr:pyridoxamine 5'-phosphate oxidase family protein [Bacillus sp. SD075]MBO0997330.1 pyridoxamine 5'-phosphate oxidase family protein [Bacillus sp. SD075]
MEMPVEVFDLLNGKELADKQHEAMMLLTVSEEGWPHNAMISVGEIVAISRKELRICLWPDTSTTANVIRTQKATLVLFWKGKAQYIRLSLGRLKELPNAQYQRVRFHAKIVEARKDIAKYAEITSGIKIDLKNPKEIVERWRDTVDDLLQ